VAIGKDDEGLGAVRAANCSSCNATLAGGQRYCLECGARRGPVPAAFAKWLSIMRPDAGSGVATGGAGPDTEASAAPAGTVEDAVFEDSTLAERFMPEPRSAAIATMALLAFGVVVGAATGPLAQSAGISPIVVEMGSSPSATSATAEPEGEASESIVEAPAEPEATPSAVPPESQPEGSPAAPEKTATEFPEEEPLPPVQHVFMIVLGEHGYEEGFGASSQSPYLSQALPAKGELLSNYYAVTQGTLANEVALISGQGPTPATAANCPEYKDVSPGTLSAEGQAEGDGCVYPAEAKTLPGQLVEAKKSWKAYIEDIGNGQSGEPASCRHPAPGGPDDAQAPRPGDAYETWRNPFVYFHSLVDSPDCGERDVGLGQLETDLKDEKQTPAFSYIVPDACHDGSEAPCEPGQPAGLAAAQPFLEKVVPEIEASAAYKKGGLIAITFAQAAQNGPTPDASACCGTPEYPNLPAPATAPASTGPVKATGGGGRVGMLLLSPFVEPGSVNETYYNHFSMLLSIEEFFGLPSIGYAASAGVLPFESSVFNLGS
jgi:hypothetical protein